MKDKERIISISELARDIDLINKKNGKLQTHTLRYWEKQFSQIKPTILDGKRRYYTKNSADLIKLIKYLLKDLGMTIKGVKKVIKKNINSLDEFNSSSIKADYYRKNLKIRSKAILERINKIKK